MNINFDDYDYRRIADLARLVSKRGEPAFSDFLDPARAELWSRAIMKEYHITARAFGGFADAERCILGLSDAEIPNDDYPISVVSVTYDTKENPKAPTHRDFLGSVLGLGLDRSKIGDILISDNQAHIFAHTKMAGFIADNLLTVGKTSVHTQIVNVADLEAQTTAKNMRCTVNSLRVDCVIAEAFNLSRTKAADLVDAERVFLNWAVTTKRERAVSAGDTITVRKMGRVKLVEVIGQSKKGKWIVELEIFS